MRRSSSIARKRDAAGPGYTKKRKHTQQNKRTGVWAFWCEHSLNGVDRLLIILPKRQCQTLVFRWWQKLRVHLVIINANCAWQSNVPEPAVNHVNMQIPLIQLKKKTVLPEIKLLTMKCKLQPMTSKIMMFLPVAQSNKVQSHDNRIWQTYMNIFPS